MPLIRFSPNPRIRRVIQRDNGSAELLVVNSDAGRLYVKGPKGKDGDHMLVKEWIGTRLADHFRLPTLDHGVIDIPVGTDFALAGGETIRSGTVFATRAEPGDDWQGDVETIA